MAAAERDAQTASAASSLAVLTRVLPPRVRAVHGAVAALEQQGVATPEALAQLKEIVSRQGLTWNLHLGVAAIFFKAAVITALTLITSVGLWSFSSLRLQADMGLLIALWLFISAFSALFIMPAIVYVFRPAFIVGSKQRPIEQAEEEPAMA